MKYVSTSSDPELIEGCLDGQETAWECLVARYERLIYSTCRRYNLQGAEADDVAGRVWLALLQHLEGLKDRGRLASWLITTTSRECWHYRKRTPALSLSLTIGSAAPEDRTGLPEPADDSPLPEESLLRLERQQAVREGLQTLAPRCQKLLWHLFYNNAQPSYTEIAATLGLPTASIGPNRARCLEKLRVLLEKVGAV